MHICIIGAGPVGLIQCLYLLKNLKSLQEKFDYGDLHISIFERRSQHDLINPSTSNQRSINLALSWRGMKALEEVGLLEEVLLEAVPMRGRFIHPLQSKPFVQPYSAHPNQVIYSIERIKIQSILLKTVQSYNLVGNKLSQPQVKLNFRQQLLRLDPNSMILDFTSIKTVRADLVLGCDGAFSRVRSEMLKYLSGKVIQETFSHQYRELKIPATCSFAPKNYLHIWPRKDLMLIALPNQDDSFTATFFYDMMNINILRDPVGYFKSNFPDFIEIIGENKFLREWQDNPASSLVTIKVDPVASGRIVLLGDASHSILPFYGQGMNAGFEDVQIFSQKLNLCPHINQLTKVIADYSSQRIPDAEAIDFLARQNYKEMSDTVLNPFFRLQNKLLLLINGFFPTAILPRYSMIAFTSLRYSTITRREIVQNLIILFSLLALFIAFYFKNLL